jgi:hypothetical protein
MLSCFDSEISYGYKSEGLRYQKIKQRMDISLRPATNENADGYGFNSEDLTQVGNGSHKLHLKLDN